MSGSPACVAPANPHDLSSLRDLTPLRMPRRVPFFEILGGGSQERRVPLFSGNGDSCGHVVLLLRFVPSAYAAPVQVVEMVGGGSGAVIIEEGRGHHSHHPHHGNGHVVEEVLLEKCVRAQQMRGTLNSFEPLRGAGAALTALTACDAWCFLLASLQPPWRGRGRGH